MIFLGKGGCSIEAWSLDEGRRNFVNRPNALSTAIIGMPNRIRTLAVSPSQTVAAVGFERQPVELWNIERGTRTKLMGKQTSDAEFLEFSSDNRVVLVAGRGRGVELYGVETADLHCAVKDQFSSSYSAAVSCDGKQVLVQRFHEDAVIYCTTSEGTRAILKSHAMSVLQAPDILPPRGMGMMLPKVHFSRSGRVVTNANYYPHIWEKIG